MSDRIQTTQGADAILGTVAPESTPLQLGCGLTHEMAPGQVTEAELSLDETGRYVDANEAALELLGVSLPELLASPPDRFTIEPTDEAEQASLREEWASGGSRPLVGTAGLKRADGQTIRVSYAIEPVAAGFRARLSLIHGSPEARASVYTVGSVMREWRAAERQLSEFLPGSDDWTRTKNEVEMLRARYQELFRTLSGPSGRAASSD
jgi:PAS domain S-box-containing protein